LDSIVARALLDADFIDSISHKQMILIVGHLATPLSDAAFPSAAARSC
jgi:hypothetical protein